MILYLWLLYIWFILCFYLIRNILKKKNFREYGVGFRKFYDGINMLSDYFLYFI